MLTGSAVELYGCNASDSSEKERRRKNTKAVIVLLLCAILGMELGYTRFRAIGAEPTESTSISAVVLFGFRPAKELDLSSYPKDGQDCVKAYLEAISPKSHLWLQNVPSDAEGAVDVRRRNLEEQIATLLGEKTRRDARAFASAVPLLAEWEGMSEGPLDEANFADQWLTRYPDTPIASFLHLFIAHRLRAGYEAARAGREKGLRPILARRYHDTLEKAQSSSNSLISCIANDLEGQSHVYLEGHGRP